MRQLRIERVCTSTEASWLNQMEAQFDVLKRLTLINTDDPDMRPGVAASMLISATDTTNSLAYIAR